MGRRVGIIYDADYQAILDYATSQGYTLPSVAQRDLQNQLVLDLKSAGLWTKLDGFSVFATDGDEDFALIDWVRLVSQTAVNTPAFTVNQGFAGDGVSAYIASGYNPSTDAVNLALDDNSISAWQRVNNANNAMISAYGGNHLEISNDNTNTRIISLNMSLAADVESVGANQQHGLYLASRSNSANYKLYRDGALLSTETRTSVALPNAELRYLARTNNTFYNNGEVSFGHFGASFSDAEALSFYNALNTYLTAL